MTVPTSPEAVLARRSMCEFFQATVAARPDDVALRTPDDRVRITWREYGTRVRAIAAGLAAIGVRPGDTVGIMLTNRPEFHLVDAAIFHLGATPFSVYNTGAAELIPHRFTDAGNKVVVCETRFLAKLSEAIRTTGIEHVICVDGNPEGTTTLAELESAGDPDFDFDAAWRTLGPDDVLTLIYTSGTAGPPKGVELTHRNVLASVAAGVEVIGPVEGGRVVSYLSDAHLANRWFTHYQSMVTGATITTVRDARALVEVLPQVRPTVFLAVPALWYKLKAAIERAIEAESGLKQAIAAWAIDIGLRKIRRECAGEAVPLALRAQYALADRLVLAALRKRIGLDKLIVAVSGAAPLAPETLEFVLALGIVVCDGWGLTEGTSVGTVNRPGAIRIGTVGTPMYGVEVTMAGDGELLVRGANVVQGYRNDPVKTAEAFDADGWLHTGDIGTIDADGYVRIVDRKKEMIICSVGRNIAPTNVENGLKVACPLIGFAMAVGDQRDYVTALITLDPEAAKAYAKEHGCSEVSPEKLAADPEIHRLVEAGVNAANKHHLSDLEQVKNFTILPTFWELDSDELTPTLKLRRRVIAEKYAAEIDALYPRDETSTARKAA